MIRAGHIVWITGKMESRLGLVIYRKKGFVQVRVLGVSGTLHLRVSRCVKAHNRKIVDVSALITPVVM